MMDMNRSTMEIKKLLQDCAKELQSTDPERRAAAPYAISVLNEELREAVTRGIHVDRLEQICAAEKEGRCVVLPVPLGTMAYNTIWWDTKQVAVTVGGKKYWRTEHKYKVSKAPFGWLDISRWGKEVFATRKEAEDALSRADAEAKGAE